MPKGKNAEAKHRILMLDTPICRLVLKMAYPTVIALVISSINSMADTFFVSSLGTSAVAAVGVNMSLDQAIIMTGSFFAIGASSYISRLLGAKQGEKASNTLSTAFFSAFLFGLIFAVCGLLFIEPLVVLMGATSSVKQSAMDYAGYILLSAPLAASGFVLSHCLRTEGSPVYSMIGVGVGAVINIGLDPLFITALGMGIKGAALATAVSHLVSFGILVLPYLRKKSLLRLSLKLIRFGQGIFREIGLMGMPSLLRMGFSVLCLVLMNNLAGSYSDSALAAISVAVRIMSLPFFATLGFGQGFMPVAGYNWGKKKYDRVRQSFRFASFAAIIFSAILSGLICIFAENIILLFTEADMEMAEIGKFCLISQCIVMPLSAWVIIVNMLYSALGKPVGAIVLGTMRQGICYIPMFFILPALFNILGLAAAQAAADLLSFFVVIPFAIHVAKFIKKTEGGELPLPEPL